MNRLINGSAAAGNFAGMNLNNRIDGWSYDAVGNLLNDQAHVYTYDAENRIATVNGNKAYEYDAEGRRVAKYAVSGSVSASYVLGLGGEQISELGPSGVWNHSNVYADGKLLATYAGPGEGSTGYHFQLTDWLGTKRIQTYANGNQEQYCYSYPFGDFLNCGGGADATEQHFTGKEHDSETGNDYFGARYYGATLGRFLTPDWAAAPTDVPYASFGDPQSLNLYAHVGNNPNARIDLDGHYDGNGGTSQWDVPGGDSGVSNGWAGRIRRGRTTGYICYRRDGRLRTLAYVYMERGTSL